MKLVFLEIDINSRYRNYKESAHMAGLTHPISQPSLDHPLNWIPLISNDVANYKKEITMT
jgi:hypothetical protein